MPPLVESVLLGEKFIFELNGQERVAKFRSRKRIRPNFNLYPRHVVYAQNMQWVVLKVSNEFWVFGRLCFRFDILVFQTFVGTHLVISGGKALR